MLFFLIWAAFQDSKLLTLKFEVTPSASLLGLSLLSLLSLLWREKSHMALARTLTSSLSSLVTLVLCRGASKLRNANTFTVVIKSHQSKPSVTAALANIFTTFHELLAYCDSAVIPSRAALLEVEGI